MGTDSVIPDNNSPLFPLKSDLGVRAFLDMIVQEVQDDIFERFQLGFNPASEETRLTRLFFLQSHNSACKLAIDVKCFLSCNRMPANKRVVIFYRFAANDAPSLSGAGIIRLRAHVRTTNN